MKLSALMLGLLVCASSFAAEVNGFTVTGLPTASNTYSYTVQNSHDVEKEKVSLGSACNKAKASAEEFARSNGFKILSSKGCKVSAHTFGGDMTVEQTQYDTSFEVVFSK